MRFKIFADKNQVKIINIYIVSSFILQFNCDHIFQKVILRRKGLKTKLRLSVLEVIMKSNICVILTILCSSISFLNALNIDNLQNTVQNYSSQNILNLIQSIGNQVDQFVRQTKRPSVILLPGEGESVRALPFPNSTRIYKLRGKDTNGLFTMMEGNILIGEGPQLHIHHWDWFMYQTRPSKDETFRVLDGELQFIIDNRTFFARAGEVIHAPKETKMSFRNYNSTNARLQIIFTPSGIEDYFAKVSKVYMVEPIDHKRSDEIAKEFGMDMLRECFDFM
ncbi:unnamed protein product [Didymodactylos carnosus]|uniref:Cupin 2 conserved barrel domain-containing protein n=1 Tax=Didymodactylos carnosus TaxID=1234261 RepID=A0A814VIX3_9BILA|nr:unnamed protein product [Didymodactylos carnosus]CAF3955682.1 unnamed protein product [Didymodactylos carnosus]